MQGRGGACGWMELKIFVIVFAIALNPMVFALIQLCLRKLKALKGN